MEITKQKHQKTLKLLLISHGICALLLLIPVLILSIFIRSAVWVAFGILIGGAGGAVLILSMSYSIQKAIIQEVQSAQKYMLKHYAIRLLVMLALLLIGIFNGTRLFFGIVMGLLCVKISGFLAPRFMRE